MIFTDLRAGDTVFLDANTLIYYFTGDPLYGAACRQLLQRIENREVGGLISTHIMTEAVHRLMTIEATVAFGWPTAGTVRRLRRHPGQFHQLTQFRQAAETVLRSQIQF